MEATVHRFARLLRAGGIRISVSEILDAVAAVANARILSERELFRAALRSTLLKDERDGVLFAELFDQFFAFVEFGGEQHRSNAGKLLGAFDLADEPGQRPPRADMESEDAELSDLLSREKLIERYSPHPELNPIELDDGSADNVVFSQQQVSSLEGSNQVRLDVDRLNGAAPGQLATAQGRKLDASLSPNQQDALLGWLDDVEQRRAPDEAAHEEPSEELLAALPEALRRHLEYLMTLEADVVERSGTGAEPSQAERDQLEASLRRLASTLRGAPSHRKRKSPHGRIDSGRTMRANLRYDGVPFRPITVTKTEDKPRLMVLVDLSLSVRATARFTLHFVHGLQNQFREVRCFGFVDSVTELTRLFEQQRAEKALTELFEGDLVDTDANSDYGAVFGQFLENCGGSITRRSTVIVLGDARGNGNDANLMAFEDISRRAREVIWLTPEPRYSWRLGPCDLPSYAVYCSRVHVVRDLSGLAATTNAMAAEVSGR
ncbi:VWA domain-containing protein [Sciscionella sediminilitoris]|uniref:VWA domain-containing protein n=1 Tax=Sciscionella sediminilitoris TaxID=1445613 RepID=UPI0004DFCAC2|nr:VWA domain-containing protein [Sciscionella sp. SE31]